MKINIGLADDHQLFMKSLSLLISSFPDFSIVVEALNGKDLLKKIEEAAIQPDIVLVDVNMPQLDGVQTVSLVTERYPLIKTIALSMKSDDTTIINMLKAGCCAYLLKDIHPNELESALQQVHTKGFYNADAVNINYRRLLRHGENEPLITEKERQFLKLACSDLTYKQIALEMHLAERTIDGYRETLFEKLNVQSRVGMALESIRRNLVSL